MSDTNVYKTNPTSQFSGNVTPMPDSVLSSSPAWDPLSQIPIATPEEELVMPNIQLGQRLVVQRSYVIHPLLDPWLIDKQFRVVADGGNFKQKEIMVGVSLVSGQLSIQRNKYKTSEALSPE